MTETVRVWLVERSYAADRDLIRLDYATRDGDRYLRKEQAATLVRDDPTAALDVTPDRLSPVPDEATRERYAAEADRMAAEHDPDDAV